MCSFYIFLEISKALSCRNHGVIRKLWDSEFNSTNTLLELICYFTKWKKVSLTRVVQYSEVFNMVYWLDFGMWYKGNVKVNCDLFTWRNNHLAELERVVIVRVKMFSKIGKI